MERTTMNTIKTTRDLALASLTLLVLAGCGENEVEPTAENASRTTAEIATCLAELVVPVGRTTFEAEKEELEEKVSRVRKQLEALDALPEARRGAILAAWTVNRPDIEACMMEIFRVNPALGDEIAPLLQLLDETMPRPEA